MKRKSISTTHCPTSFGLKGARARYWLLLTAVAALVAHFGNSSESRADKVIQVSRSAESPVDDCARTFRDGLQAYYDFSSSEGVVVKDRSGAGEPVNLHISDPKAVRRTAGSLEVRGKTLIQSKKSSARITEAIRRTGEISIEAWVRPANRKQKGPARIVTLSRDGSARNFTLGQDGSRFDLRLRTSGTSENGIPSVSSPKGSLTTDLTHVVYTRDRTGQASFYLNGKINKEEVVSGETSNWTRKFRLALANEQTKDRPWLGTYFLVAIYNRDLTPTEVTRNFELGVDERSAPKQLAIEQTDDNARHFDTHIAPLLVKHCLECHDANSKEGGLILSRKESALAGGDSGVVILPGNAAESLLWQSVETDEMPLDRDALSADEKKNIREWIDAGANWSFDRIDPAVYAHGGGADQLWLQRLTVSEYIETVRSAVGIDIAEEALNLLPSDIRADGFSNTSYNLNVDLGHVEAYARLAKEIVDRIDVAAFVDKFADGNNLDEGNLQQFVKRMGEWLLRGPLSEREVDALVRLANGIVERGGDGHEAASYVLEAMLQSPRFIYRIEDQRGDGTAWPVSDYELASRLSYIIWGGPPDEELMRAADQGEFTNCNNVAAQVDRMLQDPRAVQRSAQFIQEWLNLDRLQSLQPNPDHFPNWDAALAADMRAETIAFFKEVAWTQQRPLAELLDAQVTFLTPRLAEHYGLEPEGEGLVRYDLSEVPSRGGLLTQGSVLTVGGDEASMVARGLFVMHELLRGVVKAPPPCVDVTPVPTKPGLTQRSIAEERIADATCGGCHAKFEPLAFGLEKFDGLGTFHSNDQHGNLLRDDGEMLIPGEEESLHYDSAAELMHFLADSDRVAESLTWKVTQFALGRPLVPADVRSVDQIHREAQEAGGTYASLIKAIVISDLVQLTRTEVIR